MSSILIVGADGVSTVVRGFRVDVTVDAEVVDDMHLIGGSTLTVTDCGDNVIVLGGGLDGGGTNPSFEIDEIAFVFDPGEVIAAGSQIALRIPWNCTIVKAELLADVSTTCQIDLWVDTYANALPTDADSICGGNEPNTAAAFKYTDDILSMWTTSISAGAWIIANVDADDNAAWLSLALEVIKK